MSAQEFPRVLVAYNRPKLEGLANFDFQKADRRVTVYYIRARLPAAGDRLALVN